MKPLKLFISLLLFPIISLNAIDYTDNNETQTFINMMHEKFNYKQEYLYKLFKQVRENPQVPHKITKRVVKPLSEEYRPQGSWDIFSRVHLENNQTELGVEFMAEHNKTLEKAYKEYGVPPEYITAIIGIESYYGKNRGLYYVFDSLTHLSFDVESKRKKFYQYQLQEFLRMCFREQVEPRLIKGSKSGAIGLAQFMPSNYKSLAVDFNNDGKIRISQPIDAIGSVANYFKENGWKKNEPVGVRVAYEGNRFYGLKTGFRHKYERKYLPNIYPRENFDYNKKVMLIKLEKEKYDELWYGADNFYVITRYNHSDYYAMAVHQLAKKIKASYTKKYLHKKEKMLYASTIK